MKTITKKWLPYAKGDLETARILLSQKRKTSYANIFILWHCQQAIEKILKAIAIEKGQELLKIHDLGRLQKQAEMNLEEKDMDLLLKLNGYYLRSRYPDMKYASLPNPDSKIAKEIFNQTSKLHQTLMKYLENL